MHFSKRLVPAALFAAALAFARPPNANYDESRVPNYTLPDPLVMNSGERVRDAAMWRKRRRPEIYKLFESEMFGRCPGRPRGMTFETVSVDRRALGGKAVRKEVTVYFTGDRNGPRMELLLYLPAGAKGRVPVFLGLNFFGNPTVATDPSIRLLDLWTRDPPSYRGKMRKVPAGEKLRGSGASAWQVEMIVSRGYGLATACYHVIAPDFEDGFTNGIHRFYYKPGQTSPAPDEWADIGARAWGMSRAFDYLETDKDVDAKRVAIIGHSRLGKTALWAGASDTRIAMVVANNSGEGGAAISRRMYGENVKDLNTAYPQWYCENYRKYNDRANDLPFDAHMLIALMKPRPVYLGTAVDRSEEHTS